MFGCSCSWKGLNSLSVAMCSSISHVLMHFPLIYYAKCSCAHVLTHSSSLMCFRFSASHALQSLVFIRIVFLKSRMVPNSLYVRNWLAVRSPFFGPDNSHGGSRLLCAIGPDNSHGGSIDFGSRISEEERIQTSHQRGSRRPGRTCSGSYS